MKRITFICTGNVCRSLFAWKALEKMIEGTELAGLKIESAGISPASRKFRYDGELKEALEEYGVDYSRHRPRPVSYKTLRKTSAAFTMTERQKAELEYRFPEFSEKIFLLSWYASGTVEDIEDPVGLGIEAYRKAFTAIGEELYRLRGKLTDLDAQG